MEVNSDKMKTHIDVLPNEMLARILTYLDELNDLVSCSLVCRKWWFTAHDFAAHGLSIRRKTERFQKMYYLFSFDPVKCDYHCLTSNWSFIISPLVCRALRRVKRLFLNYYNGWHLELDLVDWFNSLATLEQLQIRHLRLKEHKTLKLPELKSFICRESFGDILELDTPKLENFKTSKSFRKFEFKYPESIKVLSIPIYDPGCEKFKNLQCLYLKQFVQYDLQLNILTVPDDVLTKFPSLNEISSRYLARRSTIEAILGQRGGRREMKFVHCNIQITSVNQLDSLMDNRMAGYLFEVNTNSFRRLLEHYHRLTDRAVWVRGLTYSDLDQFFNGRIPSAFYRQFVNVLHILVSEPVDDQQQLLTLISGCLELKQLTLRNGHLHQETVDQLPVRRPWLKQLTIDQDLELDLEFVFGFFALKQFHVNQTTPVEFIWQILVFYPIEPVDSFEFSLDKQLGAEGVVRLESKQFIQSHFNPSVTIFGDLIIFDSIEMMVTWIGYVLKRFI